MSSARSRVHHGSGQARSEGRRTKLESFSPGKAIYPRQFNQVCLSTQSAGHPPLSNLNPTTELHIRRILTWARTTQHMQGRCVMKKQCRLDIKNAVGIEENQDIRDTHQREQREDIRMSQCQHISTFSKLKDPLYRISPCGTKPNSKPTYSLTPPEPVELETGAAYP